MNLIAKVEELKRLGDFTATSTEIDALLSILCEMRAGDADTLVYAMSAFITTNDAKIIDCLRRYQVMASKMEEEIGNE